MAAASYLHLLAAKGMIPWRNKQELLLVDHLVIQLRIPYRVIEHHNIQCAIQQHLLQCFAGALLNADIHFRELRLEFGNR